MIDKHMDPVSTCEPSKAPGQISEECLSKECNLPGFWNIGCGGGHCIHGIPDPKCKDDKRYWDGNPYNEWCSHAGFPFPMRQRKCMAVGGAQPKSTRDGSYTNMANDQLKILPEVAGHTIGEGWVVVQNPNPISNPGYTPPADLVEQVASEQAYLKAKVGKDEMM